MTLSENTPKEYLFTYQGKEFKCDEDTIRKLNYALALNRALERYERVKPVRSKRKSAGETETQILIETEPDYGIDE